MEKKEKQKQQKEKEKKIKQKAKMLLKLIKEKEGQKKMQRYDKLKQQASKIIKFIKAEKIQKIILQNRIKRKKEKEMKLKQKSQKKNFIQNLIDWKNKYSFLMQCLVPFYIIGTCYAYRQLYMKMIQIYGNEQNGNIKLTLVNKLRLIAKVIFIQTLIIIVAQFFKFSNMVFFHIDPLKKQPEIIKMSKRIIWNIIKQLVIFVPLISQYVLNKESSEAKNDEIVILGNIFFYSHFAYACGCLVTFNTGVPFMNFPGYIGSVLTNFIIISWNFKFQNKLVDYITGKSENELFDLYS